jgi:hypothetical protein
MSEVSENKKILLSLIEKYHDPTLVKPEESPNGNIITMIWNDGEITTTKGGWAFLQRSQFSQIGPISKRVSVDMPSVSGKFTYAIVEDTTKAKEIRKLMSEL